MRDLLHYFVRNTVLANLLVILIISAGVLSTLVMIRELLPSFAVEYVVVRVPYPGAGPEEVEEGIILKIEDALEPVQGIKRLITTSSENLGTAIVQANTGQDIQVLKDRVTDRVNAIQNFPDDAERPSISELIIRRDTIFLAISGDIPERQLKELANEVKDEMLQLPNVSDVEIRGTRPYEISIEVSEETLRRYGLTFQVVADIVSRSSIDLPGGRIRSETEEIDIRTQGRSYTGNEYGEIVLIANEDGTLLRLRDVADIRDGFVEDQLVTRYNGKPAVSIVVMNADDEDALRITADVHAYLAEKNAQLEAMGLGERVSIEPWLDSSVFITERINLLLRSGIIGLTLVFLMLYLFLDGRLAFWVTMGIPISLSGGLFLMWAVGESLNMISLFAMIMVLGIVVDDAIIVGESIYVHRKMGKNPIRAAVDGTIEVAMPVFAAIFTSCVAFAPLLYVTGIMGKFIKVIPTVVICALLVSLIEALIILPAHLNRLPDMNGKTKARTRLGRLVVAMHSRFNGGLERMIDGPYRRMLAMLLSWRYASIATLLAIMMITIGVLRGGFVQFEFFPSLDTSYLLATVEFPEGTPIEITEEAMIRLEEGLRQVEQEKPTASGDPLIVGMQSTVGQTLSEATGDAVMSGSHKGQLLVELLDAGDRNIYYRDIVQRWQEIVGPIAGAVSVRIDGETGGPPGKPIEIWIKGRDLDEMSRASADLREALSRFAGVYQIEDDFRPGRRELRAQLKPEARTLGLTTGDLARQLRAGFFGEEALRVQRGRDEVRVWVRYPEHERRSLSNLDVIRIRTPQGDEVPLFSVADTVMEEGYTTIRRVDGLRRIAITADIFTDIANAGEVVAALQRDFLPTAQERYPDLTFAFEGDQAEQMESFASLRVTFPLAILGIFLIIATLFRSYIQPILILITVPFGIIGAVAGHILLGYSLTMMSAFGIVALAGVVVNDAIVLIEAVNQRLADGMRFATAVVEGGCRRFRAIFLTTVTTVGGLTPLIMERSFQAQFLIPMAITIAAGVVFASILTLVVLPCLFYILNDLRMLIHRIWHGEWPNRERVEPATRRHLSDRDYFADDPSALAHPTDPSPAG